MFRWNAVDSAQRGPCGNDVDTFRAVADYLNSSIGKTIFDDDHQPCPSFGQIVGGHSFATFVAAAFVQRQVDDCVR